MTGNRLPWWRLRCAWVERWSAPARPLQPPPTARPVYVGEARAGRFVIRTWHTVTMASTAKLTIRVTSTRGASTIQYSSNGRYVSLPTNGLTNLLQRQPIQPTSSRKNFWLSVIGIVQNDITAHP